MKDISTACQAVGFNTIPAWLRPYDVLSTGEKFRVDLARRLAESEPGNVILVDEFTSVVDRQVAKIGANAVQKWVRRQGDRQFVAVSCHADIIDWLQPDWIIEPAERRFTWRSVQPRPHVEIEIAPVGYGAWQLFAPFHYLTADLNRTARCFAAFVDGEPVAFAGCLRRPHPKVRDIMGVSRLVTLPDWQGLGLAFVLVNALGGAYKAVGERLHTYPAHPALIHGFDRSPVWSLKQRPGYGGSGRQPAAGRPASWVHVAEQQSEHESEPGPQEAAQGRRQLSRDRPRPERRAGSRLAARLAAVRRVRLRGRPAPRRPGAASARALPEGQDRMTTLSCPCTDQRDHVATALWHRAYCRW